MHTVEPFDPHAASEDDLADWVAAEVLSSEVDLPADPLPSAGMVLGQLLYGRRRRQAWVHREAGRVVGWAVLVTDSVHNTHLGEGRVVVTPAARRQGRGRALLDVLVAETRAQGRRTLLLEAPDGTAPAHFLAAVGAEPALVDTRSVQRLDQLPELSAVLDRAVARAAAAGYRLVGWTGVPPEELMDGYVAVQQAMASMPLGTLDWEPEQWRAEDLLTDLAAAEQRGQDFHTVVAVDASGAVGAYTELMVHRDRPVRANQGDTGVLTAHRGQGLGLAVKAAMLQRLAEHAPAVREVETWNATANEHMLAINTALGYVPEDTWTEHQLRL